MSKVTVTKIAPFAGLEHELFAAEHRARPPFVSWSTEDFIATLVIGSPCLNAFGGPVSAFDHSVGSLIRDDAIIARRSAGGFVAVERHSP